MEKDSIQNKVETHHHHILSNRTAFTIAGALMFLTAVTVALSFVPLGRANFLVALLLASVKALLVALFFMNLYYDSKENGVIFGTSFLFLAIFVVLSATDLFFRGNVYVKKGDLAMAQSAAGGSQLKDPWVSTPELISRGRPLFMAQCTSCHGNDGRGDGPAASALIPPPRNFHAAEGWKNGRKASEIFKTLKEGIPGSSMASYATLPADDRWALTHYVVSLMEQKPAAVTPEDLTKIGIDPNQQGGGEKVAPTITVELAMERMAVQAEVIPVRKVKPELQRGFGAQAYQSRCVQCHGETGEGGKNIGRMGGETFAYETTRPLTAQLESLRSTDAFRRSLVQGQPGRAVHGFGQLTEGELDALYGYVRQLVQ